MASQALQWDAAESKIDRFNKPLQPMEATTYGFKGYPDKYMMEPKRPLRHQQSADITADVNRYFRKDSPTEWIPPPNQPAPRMPTPPPPQPEPEKRDPEWLQPVKRESPRPDQPGTQLQATISPRYKDDQPSYRKPPVIRDPLRELTSAEKRKKMEEFYQAEEDLAIARRKREEQKIAKIEEQQKIREMQEDFNPYGLPGGGAPLGDNRKMKFTEHQLMKPSSPRYTVPKGMRYGDENRVMDGVRTSMDVRNDMPERKEDILRQQERQIEELRRSLNDMERERQYEPRELPRYEPSTNKMEMLEDQSRQLRKIQDEIDRLKANDDLSYRPTDRPSFDPNPRAQSEPQTDRPFRRNRDREIFGESKQSLPDYLNISPRRRPERPGIGQLYNKESTYMTDFDPPFLRHGRRGLINPNKEPYEPYNPFGQEGGGAPMVDAAGHRKTRIAGSLGVLGRELSDSARARRAHKQELLHDLGEQAAYERARKEAEKAYARQGFVEVADVMRQQKVGYPRFKTTGLIDNHHLPHMFNTTPYSELSKQRAYHDYLAAQIEEKNRNIRLGQLEEKRQAREHFRTQDSFFGRRGGGNMKGEDLRKVNLDKAIHNPQTTSQYYNKVRLEDEFSPPDILNKFKPRVTVNSTHRNLYEYPEGNVKSNYMGGAPYAEGMY